MNDELLRQLVVSCLGSDWFISYLHRLGTDEASKRIRIREMIRLCRLVAEELEHAESGPTSRESAQKPPG
jgi:hypothetical protein